MFMQSSLKAKQESFRHSQTSESASVLEVSHYQYLQGDISQPV